MIGANRSFVMKPAAKAHGPPCKSGEISKEQQAVVDWYRKQQDVIDRYREGVAKSVRPGLSAVQRRSMESVAECPVAKRDDTVRGYKSLQCGSISLQSQLSSEKVQFSNEKVQHGKSR